MREIKARLIISDFDGTLLSSEHKVSDEVRDAIRGYVADGGIFAVITGRIMSSILPEVRSLGLKGLVVASQGTVIADIESGRLIKNGGFDCAQSAEICKAIEEKGFPVNAYHDDVLLTDLPSDDKHLKIYKEITGVRSLSVDEPLSAYIPKNKVKCQKIASLCRPDEKLALFEYLLERFSNKYDVTYSADVLVEISPLGDDKGAALKYLADYYNIPIDHTVAVGDNLNDKPMIETAGVGVAVGNAVDRLKSCADFVTVTNDEGAVARVIEKFGYGEDA